MAKKIFIAKDRMPARPLIRQAAGDSSLECAVAPGARQSAGLTDIDSIIMGISSNLQRAAQPGRAFRKGRSRTRFIAIGGFEEVRFELEITLTGGLGKVNGKKINGRRVVAAPAPGSSKRARKSKAQSAQN